MTNLKEVVPEAKGTIYFSNGAQQGEISACMEQSSLWLFAVS
jgi:hypothetical protein